MGARVPKVVSLHRPDYRRVSFAGILHGMTSTTIKVGSATHDRLRRLAKASGMTQGEYIESLLDQREEADFWQAIEALDPAEVREAVAADGDEASDDYRVEDNALSRADQGE